MKLDDRCIPSIIQKNDYEDKTDKTSDEVCRLIDMQHWNFREIIWSIHNSILVRLPKLVWVESVSSFSHLPNVNWDEYLWKVLLWLSKLLQQARLTWSEKQLECLTRKNSQSKSMDIESIYNRYNNSVAETLHQIVKIIRLFSDLDETWKVQILCNHAEKKRKMKKWIVFDISLLEIVFVVYEREGKRLLWENCWKYIDDMIRHVILVHLFNLHLFRVWGWERNLSTQDIWVVAALCADADSIIKKLDTNIVLWMLLYKKFRVPKKVTERYIQSDLIDILWWDIVYRDKKWDKIELPQWTQTWIHELLWSWWWFLCDLDSSCPLIWALLWVSTNLQEEKKQRLRWLSNYIHFRRWTPENILSIIVCEVEEYKFLSRAKREDLDLLWEVCINYQHPEYSAVCDISFMRDLEHPDVMYLLWLWRDTIISISKWESSTEELLEMRDLHYEVNWALRIFPRSLAWHKNLENFAINIKDTDIDIANQKIWWEHLKRLDNLGVILDIHATISQWRDEQELEETLTTIWGIVWWDSSLYIRTCSTLVKLSSDALVRLSMYFPTPLWVHILKVIDEIEDFIEFLDYNPDFQWEDTETIIEIYESQKQRWDTVIQDNINPNVHENSLEDELIEIFGEEYVLKLYNLWLSKELLVAILDIWEIMPVYFRQIFIDFLIKNSERIPWQWDHLTRKLLSTERLFIFFESFWIHTLENPEKLFEFLILWSVDISHIDTLYHAFENYDLEWENYWDFVSSIMRFLKNPHKNSLKGLKQYKPERWYRLRKSTSNNQVARISAIDCERKLIKLWYIHVWGKWSHRKFKKKDWKWWFILFPVVKEDSLNKYMIRSLIKKLWLTREEWHKL